MDFWSSSNHRTLDEVKGKKLITRGDGEGAVDKASVSGPVLSPGNGTSNAANLRTYDSARRGSKTRLEWDFVTHKGSPLRTYHPTTLLPEHLVDLPSVKKLSSHRYAEEGARFLRQRYPDIDIPFEIIKEYMDDDRDQQTMYNAEPRTGNRLALVHSHHASRERQIAFVFPTGRLGNQLNVSSSGWSRSRGVVLNIASSPVATFDTPITQVVSSTYNHQGASLSQDLPTVSVRTMSFCALFSVNFGSMRSAYSQPSVNQLMLSKVMETGPVLDMSASPFTFSRTALVNERGAIMIMQTDNANINLINTDIPTREGLFWRVCWANEENTVLRSNSRQLEMLDIRGGLAAPGITVTGKEKITGLEAKLSALDVYSHLITVTTNRRVIWLDDRYLTAPLLSWEHNRAEDLTLRATTYPLGQRPITCLSSERNGLLTLYDTSISSSRMYSNGMPQAVESGSGGRNCVGRAFYQHPASESRDVNLVVLSSGGGLFSTRISSENSVAEAQPYEVALVRDTNQGEIVSQWDKDVYGLVESNGSRDDPQAFNRRDSFEVDFCRVYQELRLRVTSKFTQEESIDQVRDILEQMPRVWQESDRPLETIMTMQDVASCASAEPGHITRADFLTGTPINSQRAKSAFQNGHLIVSRAVGKGSTWSFDLSRSIDLVRTYEPNPTQAEAQYVTYEGKQHNTTALVNIDLALGNDIYTVVPFKGIPKSPEEILRQATQSMSIAKTGTLDPPPLAFSFLNPRIDSVPESEGVSSIHTTVDPMEDLQSSSIGIRHLLSDWELGSDPTQFQYVNPYLDIVSEEVVTAPHKRAAEEPDVGRSSLKAPQLPSSAPPKIGLVQNTRSMLKGREPTSGASSLAQAGPSMHGSTQITTPRVDLTTRSQDPEFLGINTQIMPGKHGGRSKGGSKKAKKRMGGF